ncbi:MAG: hypothetical protein L0H94_06190 [Nitrospira sp.]|nr:hypothetical protein [Nitrospira sp.]
MIVNALVKKNSPIDSSVPAMKGETVLTIVPADEDLDLGRVEERPPLIPEGQYEVGFLRASKRFRAFERDNVYLHFQVCTMGEYESVVLYMPVRISPRKGCTAMAASSKLARAASIALGRPASRFDRISTRVFLGKRFLAAVRTVDRNAQRKPLPVMNQYSVIDMLLEKTAGA